MAGQVRGCGSLLPGHPRCDRPQEVEHYTSPGYVAVLVMAMDGATGPLRGEILIGF